MARPYQKLRMLMAEYGITQEELAQVVGCTRATISNKMCANTPWTTDEMWKIMEFFEQRPEKLHEIFPKDGQNEPGARRAKRTA